MAGNGHIVQRGHHGGAHGQVEGRVVEAQAAGNVQEHVVLAQAQAGALFEHGQQHLQALAVEAGAAALRGAVGGGRHGCVLQTQRV